MLLVIIQTCHSFATIIILKYAHFLQLYNMVHIPVVHALGACTVYMNIFMRARINIIAHLIIFNRV